MSRGRRRQSADDASVPTPTLRAPMPDDLPFFFELFRASHGQALTCLPLDHGAVESLLQMQFNSRERSFRSRFGDAGLRVVLAGDRPIGRVWVARNSAEMRLVDIALLPEFRGKGIGAALIWHLTSEVHASQLPLRISVLRDNPAMRLYQRAGFRTVNDTGVYVEMEWTARTGCAGQSISPTDDLRQLHAAPGVFGALLSVIALAVAIVIAAPVNSPAVGAKHLVWGESSEGTVSSKPLYSGTPTQLVNTATNVLGITVDPIAEKAYWVTGNKIERSGLDGSGREDVVTGLGVPKDLALDLERNYVYWTDDGVDKVQRCPLGSSPSTSNAFEDVAVGVVAPEGIALDVQGGEVYWGSDNTSGAVIAKCSIDSLPCTTPTMVVTGLGSVADIALNLAEQEIYWIDWWHGRICRASLGGGTSQVLYSDASSDLGAVAVAHREGHLYWSESAPAAGNRRSGLDGSGPVDIVAGVSNTYGMALLYQPIMPEDVPLIELVRLIGMDGEVELTWRSVSNLKYQVSFTTNLLDGFGPPIVEGIDATPPANVFTNVPPLPSGCGFYRIETR